MFKKIALTFIGFTTYWMLLLTYSCMNPESSSKVYTIARDPTWYPINLMGQDANLTAFTDDLLATIASDENIHIQWGSILTEDLFQGLEEGDYDAILTFKTPSSKNRQNFLFSPRFFLVGPVLLVRASSNIKSLNELENAVIGIDKTTSFAFELEKYPSIVFHPYDNTIFELDALIDSHIDGAVVPAIPAYTYANSLYKGMVRIIQPPLTRQGLRVATTQEPSGKAFMKHFTHGLKVLKENGTYAALLKKWGFYDTDGSVE